MQLTGNTRGAASGRRTHSKVLAPMIRISRPLYPAPRVAVMPQPNPSQTHPALEWLQKLKFHNEGKWSSVKTEEDFMSKVDEEVEAGHCPASLVAHFKDFYKNYKKSVLSTGIPGFNEELATKVQASILENVLDQIQNPFVFKPFHHAVESPISYFDFGQAFTAPLINFDKSLIGHVERLDRIEKELKEGHNVIIVANHQTEVDPAVWSHLLTKSHPSLARDIIYIAGDRVVTDAIFRPLSMGRNLFCVHSKKHLNDDPELKQWKMETNRRTLMETQKRLSKGGALVWVAPSGGRDRPKADGHYLPDKFDPSVVDLMTKLLLRSKCPGHLIPMAMYSYPMMPPPQCVESAIGEQRLTAYSPIGISLCEDLPIDDESKRAELASMAWEAVTSEWENLEAAISDPTLRGEIYKLPVV